MTQTLEEILREILGQQIIQIAALTSKVQQLQEQLAALDPSTPAPPSETQSNA